MIPQHVHYPSQKPELVEILAPLAPTVQADVTARMPFASPLACV